MVHIVEGEHRRLVQTRFGAMHLWMQGEGDTPVILLHMSMCSGRMYREFAGLLAPYHPSIAPDRLGSGFSDHPSQQLSLEQYAEATVEALEEIGVDSFHILGVHTGSCEAIELAAKFPDQVKSIGLVAVPVFKPETLPGYKASYLLEPEPDQEGTHLDWYWRWWRTGGFAGSAVRSRDWPPDILNRHLIDHLLAQPDAWWPHHAVFDHNAGILLKELDQPVLVLDVPDDLAEETAYAHSYFPDQTQVVSLPTHTDVLGHFTTGAQAIANEYLKFLREFATPMPNEETESGSYR